MRYTRRDLMKQVSIAMASLAATRCTRVTCYILAELPTETPSTDQLAQQTAVIRDLTQDGAVVPSTAQRAQATIGRERLRTCWLQLQQLATVTAQDGNRGETMRAALIAEFVYSLQISRWVTVALSRSLSLLDWSPSLTSGSDWLSQEPRTPFQAYIKKSLRRF
jgi:hypothetical protein